MHPILVLRPVTQGDGEVPSLGAAQAPLWAAAVEAPAADPDLRAVVKVPDDFTDEYPDGNSLAAEVYATLIRAGQALNGELDRAMIASYGSPQAIMNCLAVIEGADTALTPSQISVRTLISSATMTNTLDTLERLGWARRVANPDDRRSVLVEITDEGQAIADRFLPGIRTFEQAVLSELTSTERATLLKLLGKVLKGTATIAAAEPIPLEGRRIRPERRR